MKKILMCMFIMLSLQQATRASEGGILSAVCDPPQNIAITDYRDRSTPQLRWNIDDNMNNHLRPAMERMAAGEYSRRVMADINWTLVRYPNHQVALDLLIKYIIAGGKLYEFYSPECYLDWGQRYYPDDDKVALARGYYFWKTGKVDQAKIAYQEALKINPDSPAACYNLGLILLDERNYAEAARYAAFAYSLGYPLTGLREKLAAAGVTVPDMGN